MSLLRRGRHVGHSHGQSGVSDGLSGSLAGASAEQGCVPITVRRGARWERGKLEDKREGLKSPGRGVRRDRVTGGKVLLVSAGMGSPWSSSGPGLKTAGSGLGQSERTEGGGGRPALGELGDDGGREAGWQGRLTPDALNVGQGG